MALCFLAAATALTLYFTVFAISKDDYKRALELTKTSYQKAEKVNDSSSSLFSSDNAKVEATAPKAQAAVNELRSDIDKLKKEKRSAMKP